MFVLLWSRALSSDAGAGLLRGSAAEGTAKDVFNAMLEASKFSAATSAP